MATNLLMNCNQCKHGELYPDSRIRCSIEKCKYEQGTPKLWHKQRVRETIKRGDNNGANTD